MCVYQPKEQVEIDLTALCILTMLPIHGRILQNARAMSRKPPASEHARQINRPT